MASIPSTPKSSVKKSSPFNLSSPNVRSISKKTIVTLNEEDVSYIEDEDATYYNETTAYSDDDELDEDLDEDDEDDEEEDENLEVEKIDKKNIIIISDEEELQGDTIESKTKTYIPQPHSKFYQFLIKHEIPRKTFHSSIGFFTLWLYTLGTSTHQLIAPMFTILVLVFANDFIRFQNPSLNRKIVKYMWFIIREKEVNEYNGVLWYLIGLIIVFSILPKDICVMSVLLLSWADTAASTFGRQFGKYTPQISKGKSLAGSIASFIAGIISCYILYGYFIPTFTEKVDLPGEIFWTEETSSLNLFVFSLFCGFIASVSEFINLFDLDDNFTIPVLSGFFIYGLVNITRI
ncbi:cytidylyltransferase family-domain-containing protein [Scheffersomyces amazonensis]|uniref:cytidylyltransferase family-domain-containing protein n=1 Tax=Scheffersomyces amazonensis TaxID=1078765 RepID=UPI00315D8F56